jgi:heme-degrading monooxygenase HmoA
MNEESVSSQIVTVFRSRLRADAGDEYAHTAAEMERRAREVPGFVDFKTFVADDGERVSLVTFASRAGHDAWREDPRHLAAQQRGREHWYAEYRIQVCELLVERSFSHSPA